MAKPSKGCWVRKRGRLLAHGGGEAALHDGEERLLAGLVRAARLRSAQRWVRSMAARVSASSAVESMQTSSTIMTSEPMAFCMSMEVSGESRW